VTELADLKPGAQYTVQVRARGVDGRLGNFSDAVTVADTDPVIPGTINTWSFLPHDAILSWVLAVAVCLSVRSRCCVEMAGRIDLVFGLFPPVLHCGSVAEWLACWTQAQKGLGSNRSRDAVG